MNQLSNAFSLLELDVAEDDQTGVLAVEVGEASRKEGKSSEEAISKEITLVRNEKVGQSQELSSGEYKFPLVWIDLEMTGLNVEVDRILEIACIITDGKLTKLIEGPDLVIHQPKECLDRMGEWCQNHHAESGLTERVLQSTITEQEAENQVMEFVKRHVGTYKPLLAGNSIYMDLLFLKKYMPNLASLFSHVLVDVSSVKALCLRWYPKDTVCLIRRFSLLNYPNRCTGSFLIPSAYAGVSKLSIHPIIQIVI